ncbi:diol dehydratase small subunit [Clostridium kluyveri]|uniref:Dehydratase n=1 Tax=Clostridium kluyveri TaxID=1534 RepID=A0A1L5F5H0_CLOKL|nr:diol dehydratase small subunit [Clostridium kluyveri]APM38227.1 dehydratase [Clostridium kluyveri]UZQ51759.1 diol dehydratase small subunit [Clostridium kluyveri]
MSSNDLIEQIVKEVLKSMESIQNDEHKYESEEIHGSGRACEIVSKKDYPLGKKRPELIKTSTGKSIDDISLENVLNGKITLDDVKINKKTLLYQAQIAESVGNIQLAANLRRAAELTVVPDARVLEIYNALKPHKSTRQQLIEIAEELENKYKAKLNAEFVREAAESYEKRNMIKV